MRTPRTVAVGMLLALSFSSPGSAAGQQSKEQQVCINTLNKGAAKVSATQFKELAKCVKAYAEDPGSLDPYACITNSVAVDEAMAKATAAATSKCAIAPTIGPTDAGFTVNSAESGAQGLASTLLGDFATDIVKCTDAPAESGCKCQNTVIKQTAKLLDFYLKSFNKCKKSGLKATGMDQIVDSSGLLACIIDPAKLDPGAKLAKRNARVTSAMEKDCVAPVTNPLPHSFDCGNKTGADLAACISTQTRCEACVTLNVVDYLSSYDSCEIFDDGIDNSSCHGS